MSTPQHRVRFKAKKSRQQIVQLCTQLESTGVASESMPSSNGAIFLSRTADRAMAHTSFEQCAVTPRGTSLGSTGAPVDTLSLRPNISRKDLRLKMRLSDLPLSLSAAFPRPWICDFQVSNLHGRQRLPQTRVRARGWPWASRKAQKATLRYGSSRKPAARRYFVTGTF